MSFQDLIKLECNQCGSVDYYTYTDYKIIECDCTNCRKRLIWKHRKKEGKKRGTFVDDFYVNGCKFLGVGF